MGVYHLTTFEIGLFTNPDILGGFLGVSEILRKYYLIRYLEI